MKKILFIGLVIIALLSFSAVSANENATEQVSVDEAGSDDLSVDQSQTLKSAGPTKVKIISQDYSSYYDSNKKLHVQVKDMNGNPVKDALAEVEFSNGYSDYEYTKSNGKYAFDVKLGVGNYKAKLFVNDGDYKSTPIKINVKITKAQSKITVKKITSYAGQYTKLKATVKDRFGDNINSGNVKFQINGKTYKVKVKNGVAIKKIKFKTAKTYTYKATFSSKNYKTKVASSKVVVKKEYYIKKCGYTFKLSEAQYKRIQYVKNHKYSSHLSKYADFKVKTNKYHDGMPVYAVITTWSGIMSGHYYNYPEVQFVTMYGSNPREWDYLTDHYKL